MSDAQPPHDRPLSSTEGDINTVLLDERNLGIDAPLDSSEPRTLWGDAWYDLKRSKMFWLSAVMMVFVAVIVIFPGLLADRAKTNSLYGGCNLTNSLLPPSSEYWFGTDQLGCDVYSMTIFGARPSVMVGVIATVVTALIGSTLGLLAGYYGGKIDSFLSRVIDVFYSLPLVVVGIAVLSNLSLPGIWGVTLVLCVIGWVSIARMVRGQTIEAKAQDFTTAAKALGASDGRIMSRHILPNTVGPAIVLAVLGLAAFISTEATFSYLGLGIRPPLFSWGTIIAESQSVFFQAPWTLLFPAAFLILTILSVVLLGESMSEALDPKLRR